MSIPDDPAGGAESPTAFRSIGGGRYEPADCPTGRCPRVNVAEIPYERQIDEDDDAYGQRLRRRANVAADIGNDSELIAILTAMQDDLEIPESGLTIPCQSQDEWLTLAFLQGIHPDSWQTADPEPVDFDLWFNGEAYSDNLRRFLRDKFTYGSMSGFAQFAFVGPDGLPYRTASAVREPNNQLRLLYIELSTHLGYAVADAGDQLAAPTSFASLETTEPPAFGIRSLMWEFESEMPPSEADHGENIVLAQWTPDGRGIRGPLNQPTGRPRTSVGSQPGGPRTGVRQSGDQPPRLRGRIPQWLAERFARGRANEARTLRDNGMTKNRNRVTSRDDNGRETHTYPDAMPPGQVVEVKDVRVLANTRQIQAQRNYARDNGLSYTIYTGPVGQTSLTNTMQRMVDSGQIRIVRVPYLGRGDP